MAAVHHSNVKVYHVLKPPYPYPSIPLCFCNANVSISLDSCSLGLPKGAQIIKFIIHIL